MSMRLNIVIHCGYII